MKLSEYIKEFQELYEEHGELDCIITDENGYTFSDAFFTHSTALFDENGRWLKYTNNNPSVVIIR